MILQRYIFRETLIATIIGIGVFTFGFMMGKIFRIVDMMMERGIPAWYGVKLFLCLTPSFLIFVIPMAFLLGVLVSLGRMNVDREILALKTSGIGIMRLVPPLLLLASVTTVVTALLLFYGVPYGSRSFRETLFEAAQSKITPRIREGTFNNLFSQMVIYSEKTTGGRWERVMAYREENGGLSVIFARKGILMSEPGRRRIVFRFRDGNLHQQDEKGGYQIINFDTYDLNISLEEQLRAAKKMSEAHMLEKEMSISDLKAKIERYRKRGRDVRPLFVELHFKFAIPFAAFVFALLGIPLGAHPSSSGRSWGFILSSLVILIYYVMYCVGKVLATAGVIPPWTGAWLPNITIGLLGIYLLIKVVRESPILLLDGLGWMTEGGKRAWKRLAGYQ